jgi:hypothetical protein
VLIRSRKLKKDRQYNNGQRKKDKQRVCWYFIDNIPGINHFNELPEIMRKDSRVDE